MANKYRVLFNDGSEEVCEGNPTAIYKNDRRKILVITVLSVDTETNGTSVEKRRGSMDKVLRDLKWLCETLRKGGKTAEFYEAQAPIIGEVLKHMISAQRNEILVTEYLSKCHCCDECFCECWCIINNRRKGRVPHDGCKQNILDRLRDEV